MVSLLRKQGKEEGEGDREKKGGRWEGERGEESRDEREGSGKGSWADLDAADAKRLSGFIVSMTARSFF